MGWVILNIHSSFTSFFKRKILKHIYHIPVVKKLCFIVDAYLHRDYQLTIKQEWKNLSRTKKKYLCIFAHYDADHRIDPYVLYYLRSLCLANCDIILVSTSDTLNEKDIQEALNFCQHIIIKDNRGRDFISYKTGLRYADNLSHYEKLIFTNDSVFAPLFDIKPIISSKREADIIGITSNDQHHLHLQSYFLIFNQTAFLSPFFKHFWNSVLPLSVKSNIVQFYEIGLTRFFEQQGFKTQAIIPIEKIRKDIQKNIFSFPDELAKNLAALSKKRKDPTHFYWWILIKHYQCPILKRDLLLRNSEKINLSDWESFITCNTSYPVELISQYLDRIRANK